MFKKQGGDMEKSGNCRYENLIGSPVIDCFYYSKNMLLIAIIPTVVALGFGLELSFFRFIFPKGGSFLLTLLGYIALLGGIVGAFTIIYKLLNRKPFLILSEKGLFANVIFTKGGYIFFPWEEIVDISNTSYRTGPIDTGESPLMKQSSYDDYLILKLTPHFQLPKVMVQTYNFGDDQLGLAMNMIEGKIDEIVAKTRSLWMKKTGKQE